MFKFTFENNSIDNCKKPLVLDCLEVYAVGCSSLLLHELYGVVADYINVYCVRRVVTLTSMLTSVMTMSFLISSLVGLTVTVQKRHITF